MLPHFIIIGAMKAGTTSLYHYMASHSHVVPSCVKETDFFKTCADFDKGLDWYESLFKRSGQYAFEASPNYTKQHIFPGVPARMHSILPGIKLIYVLRDPIERVLSHYVHNRAHGTESRSFSQVVQDANSNYVQTSKYHFQIEAFLEYYSDKQLLLVESEQLRENPVKIVGDVFEFLGISLEYDVAVLEKRFHRSSAYKRRSLLERELSKNTRNRYLLASIRAITKPFRRSIKRPRLSPIERDLLAAAIGPDLEKLRRFSGNDFSSWSL